MYSRLFIFPLVTCRRLKHSLTEDFSKIRNIALLAHIDAGKTTTTERMLYYSGKILSMGEVHDGNTVTDFMELERNRGITISSAFVTFRWNKHIINLVDTPGHIDFTMEVEQSLKIIDSAVIILDASAGVEAQTLTVWQQLVRKKLPSLFYINKMDRTDADMDLCLSTLKNKLLLQPLVIHLPIKGKDILGHINVISMKEFLWRKNSETYTTKKLCDSDESYIEALNARINLVDSLSTLDDTLANTVLDSGSLETIHKNDIISALRRVSLSKKGVPVICGSSYKNVGIQSLLDAVVDYLPSPADSPEIYLSEIGGNDLIARCFKIIHDKQRGAISFFRIYSGKLTKGQKIFNICQNNTDQVGRLLKVFGNELLDISSETFGNFVAATGLKQIISGDLICDGVSTAKRLKTNLGSKFKISEDLVNQNFIQNNSVIPEPVFFCSVELPSQRWQLELEKALREIQKEDPSLRVELDSETGQTILAGMGELHLEIIKEKLSSYYGIDVDLGPIQIVYKEQLQSPLKESLQLKNSIGNEDYSVFVTISLTKGEEKVLIRLDTKGDSAENLAQATHRQISAVKSGILSALSHGPSLSSQVVNVQATIHWLDAKKSTPESVIVSAASQCVSKILKKSGTQLLEPVMLLQVAVSDEHLKKVLGDLTRRKAVILKVDNLNKSPNIKEIHCEAPLAELLGYSKFLRTITSGTASFNMEFSSHRIMSVQDQLLLLKKQI